MSLEQQVAELTARITAFETQLREIKELKGVPGPRGPAGDIAAAVANAVSKAEAVVSDAESRVQSKANTDLTLFREEIRQLKQYLDEGIKNAAENHCIQVLRDYHLLDENHAPTHWTKA